MKKLITLIPFFILSFQLLGQSQSKAITLIYKITAEEAIDFYTNEDILTEASQEKYLHNYVDSIQVRNGYTLKYHSKIEALRHGYYLLVNAKKEKLNIELHSVHDYHIKLIDDNDLTLQVLNKLNEVQSNAKVTFNNSQMKYNSPKQTYRKKNVRKDGIIKVEINGQTVFFEIEVDGDSRWEAFLTQIGYYELTAKKRRRSIRESKKQSKKGFRLQREVCKGYIIINQPKYRQGDTVKVKAYVASKKGKPLTTPLVFALYQKRLDYTSKVYEEKPLLKKSVTPNMVGNYTLEFELGDSLKLDQSYYIYVMRPFEGKERSSYFSKSFRLEDYELDKTQYQFMEANPKEVYLKKDKLMFLASARNQNGQFIADGSVRLTLLRDKLIDTDKSFLKIPDTLWHKTFDLSSKAATPILIPWEKIPAAHLKVKVIAEFYNSSGEFEEKSGYLTINKLDTRIDIQIIGSEVVCRAFKNGKEQFIPAIFYVYDDHADIEIEKEVKLPYRETINPRFDSYEIETDDDLEEVEFENYSSNLYWNGYNSGDSISIYLKNPRKIPVIYSIYKTEKLIAEGTTTDSSFVFEAKNKNKTAYTVAYSYSWGGGYYENDNLTFLYYKKDLSVKIEQPKKITPGQSVNVKIKVTDKEDKAAPGTNLTAVTLNTAFKNSAIYNISRSKEQKSKTIKSSTDDFDFENIETSEKGIITPEFYKKLNLDEKLYYRVLHPKQGVGFEYRTIESGDFYKKHAQFAPYIVKKGQLQPIYMIYCNKELIYFIGAGKNRPYSFVGKSGYNTITIRTKNNIYNIDSVLLKKGQKLEFSIDEDNYQKHFFKKNIQRTTTNSKTLTPKEIKLLNQEMLVLKKEMRDTYIWQSHQAIFKDVNRYNNSIFGPFKRGMLLHYVVRDKFQKAFEFKGGYEYEVTATQERLYESNYFEKNKKLYNYRYYSDIGALILKPTNIGFKSHKSVFQRMQSALRNQPNSNNKKTVVYQYHTDYNYINSKLDYIIWLKGNKIIQRYSANATKIKLQEGDYSILFYNRDSTYATHHITVNNDTLYYEHLDFDKMIFKTDTNYQYLESLVKQLETRPIPDISSLLDTSLIEKNGTNKVIIKGNITDNWTGESLIYASITIKNQKGEIIKKTSNSTGEYSIMLDSGIYNINVSYLGFKTFQLGFTRFQEGNTVTLDIQMQKGNSLEYITTSSNYVRQRNSVRKNNLSSKFVTMRGSVSGVVSKVSSDGLYQYDVSVPQSEVSYTEVGILTPRYFEPTLTDEDNFNTEAYLVGQYKTSKAIRSNFQDYAYWQPNLLTDQNGEAYFTVTFPDNITKWETQVIGMDRKTRQAFGFAETEAYKSVIGQLSLPRFLIEGDQSQIVGKAVNFTNDTFTIQTQFKQGDQIISTQQHQLSDGIVEKTTITANKPTEKLELTYQLTSDQFNDGEQRNIPVFEKGVRENVGQFWVLDSDTTFQYQANEAMGTIQISVQPNTLDVLMEEIEQLKVYPYDCNEQVASKLMALLLEKEVKTQLNQPFKGQNEIRKAISKLKNTQNKDGSWGWWKDNEANVMMTIHIGKSLIKASEAGYIDYDYYPLTKAMNYLSDNFLAFDEAKQYQTLFFLLEHDKANDYSYLINGIDTEVLSFKQQLLLLQAKQKANLEYSLDKLEQYRKQTTFGGSYFGQEGYSWFDNAIPLTLLAYNFYKNAKREDVCKSIRQYFLEQRKHNGWRNTYESAQILAAILPDVLNDEKENTKSTLTINGNLVDLSSKNIQINYSDTNFKIEKTGDTPIFVTAYQSFQNKSPKAKSDLFEIKTAFIQKGKTLDKSNVKLLQNNSVSILVTVNVKETADYIMIEVPIPAGCSYDAKPQPFGNYEVHREYFRNKTTIFCQQLPIGKYTFKIPLQARFTGQYTLNPAKIEQMYFPLFYGRNEGKVVELR
jgi:hypothetical protein